VQSELFRIPSEWHGIPILGVGVVLALWIIGCFVGMYITSQRRNGAWKELLPGLLIGGCAIIGLPQLFPDGLPIRGYGLMVLLGVVSGIMLAMHRAQQMGLSPDVILNLALSFVPCGIIGGRLFYVIQYWNTRIKTDDWTTTIINVFKFTEGGLVVYGAFLGAVVAVVLFVWRKGLPFLAMADLLAPSLMIGLAFGRIGCFLNGCCYGGECELPWAVTFPRDSLPYMEQIEAGKFGDPAGVNPANLPARSLPVHPAQLYSAIDAALLCWFLWSYYPYRRRDGEVAALMLMIHSISRFLLEVIRVDESAVFGTGLSISQNISILFLVLTVVGWFWLLRQPARTASFEHLPAV
jgi:phosphatidylglycerol---prolipoprotein diacylglyceryl transferase